MMPTKQHCARKTLWQFFLTAGTRASPGYQPDNDEEKKSEARVRAIRHPLLLIFPCEDKRRKASERQSSFPRVTDGTQNSR